MDNIRPSAKRIGKLDNDKNEKLKEFTEQLRINVSEKNYRKLEAISAVKNISFEDINEIINPILDEKILNIDVVRYVEELANDEDEYFFLTGRYSLYGIKISPEAYRRLKIFVGVKNCSVNELAENFVKELIDDMDLIKLVKEEFN